MQESPVSRTDPFSTFLMHSVPPSINVTAAVILGTIATVCFVDTRQSLTTGCRSHKCFQLMDQWWNVMTSLEEKGTDSCQYRWDSPHLYLSTQSSWPQLLFFSKSK